MRPATALVIVAAMIVTVVPGQREASALTAGEIKSRITSLKRSLNSLGQQLNDAERKLDLAHTSIARHEKALKWARTKRSTLATALSHRAADIYMYGSLTGGAMAAAGTDFTTYVDRLSYLEQLQAGEQGLLEEIRALQRRASSESAALRSARATAAAHASALRERQRELSSRLTELTKLDRFLASVGRGAGRATRTGVRGIVCPVVGPNVVLNNFGDPRPGGPHQGDDIRANTGQWLRAVLPGTIVEVPYGSWWGIGIVLRDLAGNEWWYAHLSTENVSVGERVSQGELIGRVGCSGRCYGPHLHFEYHPGGGNAVDPYRILSSAC